MKALFQSETEQPTLFGLYLPTDDEIARYGTMRDDYRRRCMAERFSNRCLLAFAIGARAFRLPADQLQAAFDKANPRLTEDRQRLMAFSRLVGAAYDKTPNSWRGVARAFHREPSAVVFATHKYGAQIAAAMEMKR